jgi:hypothetical protein
MGKIGRLNTIRFYIEIGAGEGFRQAGRYPGIYKLRTYKFANNSLTKPRWYSELGGTAPQQFPYAPE